eukprot:TsM_000929200 transcript=TsM_000929200 gene=TsM_000929200
MMRKKKIDKAAQEELFQSIFNVTQHPIGHFPIRSTKPLYTYNESVHDFVVFFINNRLYSLLNVIIINIITTLIVFVVIITTTTVTFQLGFHIKIGLENQLRFVEV